MASKIASRTGEPYTEQLGKVATQGQDAVAEKVGNEVVDLAAENTERERQMGVREAFKRYPKAVMFSIIFST